MRRTEAEKVTQLPIKLRFGSQIYAVPVLAMAASEEWRNQLADEVNGVLETYKTELVNTASFGATLRGLFLSIPGKVLGLVRAYDRGNVIPADIGQATDEQVSEAFATLVEVAFPFTNSIGQAVQALRVANVLA